MCLLPHKMSYMVSFFFCLFICFSPVHATLKSTFSSLVAERERLRHTMDLQAPQPAQVVGLKTAYASVSVFANCFYVSTGPVWLSSHLIPIRNVQAAPTLWSTRRPMRAKHLSQSPYQSFLMLKSISYRLPPLRMRWDTIYHLISSSFIFTSHIFNTPVEQTLRFFFYSLKCVMLVMW